MRLVDLAEAAGYSVSHISQIERGTYIPSLTALAMVAMALEVEVADLLDDSSGPLVHITRAGEGRELRMPNGRWFRIIGGHGSEGAYSAFMLQIQDTPTSYQHYGERFVLILSGDISFKFGDDLYRLGAGETLHYAAHQLHEVTIHGSRPVKALTITSPALV